MTAHRATRAMSSHARVVAVSIAVVVASVVVPGSVSHAEEVREAAPGYKVVWGVLAVAADEAYAVGTRGPVKVAARAWDGDRWVGTHPRAERPSELYAVTKIGKQVWASGESIGDGLVARWTGQQWKYLPTPPRDPEEGHFLRAIDGTSPTDVWAAGYATDGQKARPIAHHWDGTAWTTYDLPLLEGATSGQVFGITATAPDDVWAVGGAQGGRYPPLLSHWDGTTWKQVTTMIGPIEAIVTLRAVDAIATDDVWAVGTAAGSPAAAHWDGKVWAWVPIDQGEGTGDWSLDLLHGVSAVATDDVWAVGGYGDTPYETGRIVHWDGTRWHTIDTPQFGDKTRLTAVSAATSNDAWAVGTFEKPFDNDHPLYLHWDGHTWTRVRPNGTEQH